jgi:hypothetical protein
MPLLAPSVRMLLVSIHLPNKSFALRSVRTTSTSDGCKALFLANREANAGNTMNVTIGTEICDHLEKVVDRLEDVANEINAFVIDHAERATCALAYARQTADGVLDGAK